MARVSFPIQKASQAIRFFSDFTTCSQKDKKPKRSTWKSNLDLTYPIEEGNFDSGNFKQSLQEEVKISGKTGHLRPIHLKYFKNKITVISEKQLSERYLKYNTRKKTL